MLDFNRKTYHGIASIRESHKDKSEEEKQDGCLGLHCADRYGLVRRVKALL